MRMVEKWTTQNVPYKINHPMGMHKNGKLIPTVKLVSKVETKNWQKAVETMAFYTQKWRCFLCDINLSPSHRQYKVRVLRDWLKPK